MRTATPRLLGLGQPSLGDARRNRRVPSLLEKLAAKPSAPIPAALASEAETEAFYRLVSNSRVDAGAMIEPHITEVIEILPDDRLLVVHDSTNIVHATAQHASDVYPLGKGINGYVAHVSLAVSESNGLPLGVVNFETVERGEETKKTETKKTETKKTETKKKTTGKKKVHNGGENEGQRWARGAIDASRRIGPREQEVVHVMDSEGDSYNTLQAMQDGGLDFVVRSCQSARLVTSDDVERTPLVDFLPTIETTTSRDVRLSRRLDKSKSGGRKKDKRNRCNRESRMAHLLIGAGSAAMQRPHGAARAWRAELPLNVVRVWESDAPKDEPPVHWVLWTTLPVDTEEQILRVVDIYRMRWLIEELFKALKTGCIFEKRRFESKATSVRALVLYLPIAALTLALRTAATKASDSPAAALLSQDHLMALRAFAPSLSKQPTAQEALMAVARLGGHLRSNGAPGWLILARGMERLNERAMGWRLAREHFLDAVKPA